ncbi:MAG TPA: amidohydrolase family protein [Trebonia sp.]|nr:amidohydrolase family protein [Trebonia sp.]
MVPRHRADGAGPAHLLRHGQQPAPRRQGNCWIKLSGAYRVAKNKPLSSVTPQGKALVATRPDRLIWGSNWPHLTEFAA